MKYFTIFLYDQTFMRRRWEDNIRIGLGEIAYKGMDWIHLA